MLREPVVCVLGHVDTGKTKLLDKLRNTRVQDAEAGGITQQIGSTNVPREAIEDATRHVAGAGPGEILVPGLTIIDTPGHESFRNLRMRGSSLCDIAILVVDLMHGLEQQTIESIRLLQERCTPFVVALNKIDRLYGFRSSPSTDVQQTMNSQHENTRIEFKERCDQVVLQFAEQSMNVALFWANPNASEYISLVPTSAHTGDGMGNLLHQICMLAQTMLRPRISYSDELQATVMEVKVISGLGTTVDVILVNGEMHEKDTLVMAGFDGPIVTQVRSLLMPQPLRELRVKARTCTRAYTQTSTPTRLNVHSICSQVDLSVRTADDTVTTCCAHTVLMHANVQNAYELHKKVRAARGVKITAKDLERVIAGMPVLVAEQPDEIPVLKVRFGFSFISMAPSASCRVVRLAYWANPYPQLLFEMN